MLENEKNIKIPEVRFTFRDEELSEEERKKEIDRLLKKRDEILASMKISITSNSESENNEISNNYPRNNR